VHFELNELFLPYKIDTVDYCNLDNLKLKENIDKDGIIFYEAK